MSTKLFVGNLAYATMDHQLEQLFSEYGTVLSANVVLDRQTGRSRGFAFVEFEEEAAAQEAINALNESEFDGRNITVRVAYDRPPGGGGGGGFGGRGRSDGGTRDGGNRRGGGGGGGGGRGGGGGGGGRGGDRRNRGGKRW